MVFLGKIVTVYIKLFLKSSLGTLTVFYNKINYNLNAEALALLRARIPIEKFTCSKMLVPCI